MVEIPFFVYPNKRDLSMLVSAQNLSRFSVVFTVFGVVVIISAWLFDLLFLPLAILWIGPFFAISSVISSFWAYLASSTPVEKSRTRKLVIGVLLFYICLFGAGFYLSSVLVDALFF